MSYPMLSLSGPLVCRPITRVGEWVHVEFWIPLLDQEGNSSVIRCFCNVDHDDIAKGNQGAIDYVLKYVNDNMSGRLGPISHQRVVESLSDFLRTVDFQMLMPLHIDVPTTGLPNG